MIQNVEQENDNMKTEKGIGLYKIRYEMDVKGSKREQAYIAGVISYTSKEAVDTLINFAKARVKGFKGMKIEEVSFDGACHALSDKVKTAIIGSALLEGTVVSKKDYEDALAEAKEATKKASKKSSIIPKE